MVEGTKLERTAEDASPLSTAGRPAWFVLIEAIERLSAAQTFEQIQEIVRLAAREVSGADGVTFVLRDGDRCHYVEENAIGPLWRGQKFPMSSCISGWAMLNKRTAIVPDIYADARIPHDAYRPTFVKSLMMAPVRVEDPIAAIGAYWAHLYEPSANEIALLESLARATSIAIANVTLQSSLRDAAGKAQAQAEEIRHSYDELQRETEKRLQTEAQLRQAQKMEAIGQLTGGLAHDFNNLLTVIIGSLDLLAAGPVEGSQAKSLAGNALDAAVRGADLIRRLLAFARRQPLEPQRVDVNELVRKMSTLLERTLGQHIKITLDLSPATWPVIVDPAQLETSLANLATNARDAMPDGGSLRFATANRHLDEDYAASHRDVTVGDYVMIEVSDSGTGIPGALLSRIFEPFFTTKDPGKGTGLGLSMVFGFMKQSGGHINLYSEEGIGTTFRLYLPRSRDEAASAAPKPIEAPTQGHGEIVLLVEDDPAIRRLAVHQLITLNYRVVEAADVETALMALEKTGIDLLLTDLVMPGGRGGYDLVLEAQRRWPALKIILTSGLPDIRLRSEPAIAKLPLLTKPYRKLDLARALQKAFNG